MSLRDDFEVWAREFTELDLEWMEDEGGYQFLNTDFAFMAYQAATERAARMMQEEADKYLPHSKEWIVLFKVERRLKDES